MATATLKKAFTAAADGVKTLPKRPRNDQLLELYALYKQASYFARPVRSNTPGRGPLASPSVACL
jgi:acyl-CoA-binding protein